MQKNRTVLLALCFILAVYVLSSPVNRKEAGPETESQQLISRGLSQKRFELLRAKMEEAKSFVRQKGFNEVFCFMIDMGTGSGKNRFFVYDLKKDSIKDAGLVTHGRCNEWWLEGRKYGNEPGSGCTSLGKYKIGNVYSGRYGLAYKLHGLDKTNSNAFRRFIVLHAHECVPEDEVNHEICQSDGCPTVSKRFLSSLHRLIGSSQKPVLLWILDLDAEKD